MKNIGGIEEVIAADVARLGKDINCGALNSVADMGSGDEE